MSFSVRQKPHENYAYELIQSQNIAIPKVAQEVIRLHIHFGITYNGEFSPEVLLDEIRELHRQGWSRADIRSVILLTALFTFADVAAYGPITNTMVQEITRMVINGTSMSLVHLIDSVDEPTTFEAEAQDYIHFFFEEKELRELTSIRRSGGR